MGEYFTISLKLQIITIQLHIPFFGENGEFRREAVLPLLFVCIRKNPRYLVISGIILYYTSGFVSEAVVWSMYDSFFATLTLL